MRIETTKRELFSFSELPEDMQQKALENLYDINVDGSFWYEDIIEDAKTIGALMGVDIDQIYFSGFSSQGDGACFTGAYSYRKGSLKAVKDYAPLDADLHSIALELYKVQRRNFYGLSASISHRGHYYHELCTDISVDYDAPNYQGMSAGAEDEIVEALRDFMQWIYSRLESSYQYYTSEEAIKETIDANEYEFTNNGDIA